MKADEGFITNGLSEWINLTSDAQSCNLIVRQGVLSSMLTGPDIDSKSRMRTHSRYRVYLTACRGNEGDIWGCDARIVDVPADGNCGFLPFFKLLRHTGESLQPGRRYRKQLKPSEVCSWTFLRLRRNDIEDMVIEEHGISVARVCLWRDVKGLSNSNAQQMSFDELCHSIPKCGMNGHWLGAGIGEAEVHLLGRALGVGVHCVMAAKENNGSYCLRQTFRPNPAFWKGKLRGTCSGAVILRFMGSYSSGHYQHVRCGYSTEAETSPLSGASKSGTAAKMFLKTAQHNSNMKQHMKAIYKMHGVQAMTKKRYSKDYRLISNAFHSLKEKGVDPLNLKENGAAVVEAIMALLLQRCGPTRYGYEGLSAKATGKVVLAAVATWYKDKGKSFNDSHSCVVSSNSVSGPPWKAQQLLEFKESLYNAQAKAKAVGTRRAYQITHDDLLFLKDSTDADVGATLYGVKAKKGCKAVKRVLFPAWTETAVISPAFAILTQLALIHGAIISNTTKEFTLSQLPLFPNIHQNQVQWGQTMGSDTYSAAVKDIFRETGITDSATEHSPRRGGAGFRYYVLRETLEYIRDFLGHSSISETLLYIGFHNKDNSYVIQGYGSCGWKALV